MPISSFTAKLDRSREKKMLDAYSPAAIEKLLRESAKQGAKAAEYIMQAKAPIGLAHRLSQFYRRLGLGHGSLRQSVRAAPIRGRGSVLREQGQVIGPMGAKAVARAFVAHRRPWAREAAAAAFSVARDASEAVLRLYVKEH